MIAILCLGANSLNADTDSPYDTLLESQNGEEFHISDSTGKIVILNFIFTRCPIACPTQTAKLAQVQDAINPSWAKSTQFISISIDPEYDTPDKMKAFGKKHGADFSNWVFATGEASAIRSLSTELNAEAFAGNSGMDHRMVVFLLNEEGHILQHYLSSNLSVARLGEDVSSANRVLATRSSTE